MINITTHHDGHWLNDAIVLKCDDRGDDGRGVASHTYVAEIDGKEVLRLRFQEGPRNEEGSIPGITQEVLLAILIDRLTCFQRTKYACPENENALEAINEALEWLKDRR